MATVYQDKAAGGKARSSASPAAFPARAAVFGRVIGSYAGSVASISARGPVSSAIFVRMMWEMYSNLATAPRESRPGSGLRDLPPAQTAVPQPSSSSSCCAGEIRYPRLVTRRLAHTTE